MARIRERFHIAVLGVLILLGLSAGSLLQAQKYESADKVFTQQDLAALAQQAVSALPLPDGRQLILNADRVALRGPAAKQGLALPERRIGAAVVVLPDARILIWGGADAQGRLFNAGLWFDPATKQFSPASDLALPAGVGQTLTVLSDGQVLLTGAWNSEHRDLEQATLWNPRTNIRSDLGTPLSPRFGQASAVQDDGTVLLWGGSGEGHRPIPGTQSFDPKTATFAIRTQALKDPGGLILTASSPQANSTQVAADALVALRFSTPLDATSVSGATVSLIGPAGPVVATATGVQGRLVFVIPHEELLPGTRYTVALNGIRNAQRQRLPFTSFGFTTAALTASADADGTRATTASDSAAGGSLPNSSAANAASHTAAVTLYRATGVDATGKSLASSPCPQNKAAGLRLCRDKSYFQDGAWYPGQDNAGGPDSGHWRINVSDMPSTEIAARAMEKSAWAKVKRRALIQSGTGLKLSGQIRLIDGHPIAQVKVTVGKASATTDARGNFLLSGVPAGHQSLFVDGTSASDSMHRYGQFEVGVDVAADGETKLPYRMYLPRILDRDRIELPSPTTQDMVVTHPDMPGLEVHIPAGTVIRDHNGKVVTEFAIVPMPTDRAPYPTPVNFAVYFSLQPGGAAVQNVRADQPQGITLTYPNYGHVPAGYPASFIAYSPDSGWQTYGKGQITSDGTQLKAEAGVRLAALTSGSWSIDNSHLGDPNPAKPGGPCCGDPVDLLSGTLVENHTDIAIDDVIPISLTRQWHAIGNSALIDSATLSDTRSFGGWRSNYDMFTVNSTAGAWDNIGVRLPDGNKLGPFTQITSNPGGDGSWVYSGNVAGYVGATLDSPLNTTLCDSLDRSECYVLRMPNGTRYYMSVSSGLYEIRDRYDNRVQIIRNGGLIAQIVSPSGRYLSFTYNSDNNVSQIADNTGRTWSYTYHKTSFKAGTWGPGGATTTNATLYFLDKVTYPDGTATNYHYNEDFTAPFGSPGTCAAPLPSTLTSVTDRNNQTVMTNTYCGSQVSKQVLADGGTWQFAYGSGETDVTDPLGHVRKVLFDPVSGYPSSDTSAAGTSLAQTTTYVREASGLMDSTIDPLGRKTTFTYDSNGNPLTVTKLAGTADAVSQSFTWTGDSQIVSVTDELSRTTRFSYSNDCLTGVTDALNQTFTAQCNEQGQTTLITDPLEHQTELGYVGNDLHTLTDALGRTATIATDGLGRVMAVTDPMGRTAQRNYDSNGRLKTTTDQRGNVTTFTYDNEGHVVSVALPNGTIAYQYDSVYRVKQRTDALNQSESWTYDTVGNLLTYKDRKSQTMTYAPRDALGRFTSLAYADGSTVTATTYDAGNRLTLLTDSANGTVTHSYDDLDRLTGETSPQGSVVYTYYANGQRQSMTAASQAVVNYTYDAGDRLQTLSQGSDTVGFTYDAANRRQTLTLPNGIVASYSYDNANQLTGISYSKTGTTLGILTYGYNTAGQRVSQTGSLASDQLPAATTANSTFDLNNRQTAFNGLAQTYDKDGNLTGDGAKTYVWNARNQLTQIKQGSTVLASFGYDALGRRISKTLNGVTTTLLYDGLNTVQETQGATVNPILTGLGVDERFARNEGSTRNYFLTDALGSTIALTNVSAVITQTYQYDPYGNVTNTGGATNPYQYTGRENDGTGLYYYRARYYSPTMARFVSEDPLEFGGGQNNFYAYAGGNPVSYKDPQGKEFITAAIGAVAGGIAGYEAGGWRGAVVGGVVGGAVGFIAPQLSAAAATWAGGGIAGMFAATGTTVGLGAATGGIATVGGNMLNNAANPLCKKEWNDGLGFGMTLGAMAPLMSGEAFAAGAGEVAVGRTASNVFSGITGGITAIGEAFDPGAAHGIQSPEVGGKCGCGN
ncbi:RHS repeat-associated core domain-containing protein [Rhodanobacter sp. Col0626]|uniref:RHS repeat-associated core domain-containing protein n=1 Tax=Rhodanobacter sp. Col0626 TaxID=3415679 RepID=UPI003CE711AE